VRSQLAEAGVEPDAATLAVAPNDDTWVRDYGPVTVLEDGGPVLLDLVFDGWGGRFPAARDDAVTATLHGAGHLGPLPREQHHLILEGGAIDTDGAGTLLTTERCLLARDNGLPDRAAYEAVLRPVLGVERVLWLEQGALTGDDTDGHVDMLVRFCAPDLLACTVSDDPGHPDHGTLGALEEEVRSLRRADGGAYRVLRLPVPGVLRSEAGAMLPASYANFLILESAVLVPVYEAPEDARACAALAGAFPHREIVPIPARPLIAQGGAVHCATMHLPAGKRGGPSA
jgi:agmatine/peptidylarginine deiminase